MRGLAPAFPLIAFSRAHRRLVLGLAVAFAVLVAAEIHGYSISMWRKQIDGSLPVEVWLGEAQWLRADDWMVQIPFSLGQREHAPRFPVWNGKVGLGQQMLVPFHLPTAHVLTLFRPTEWGWFLGADTGLAWRWWLQAFGLFYATFLVLAIVGEGRLGLAVAGSALVVFSPFFQFWSLNAAPFVVYAELAFVAACHVLLSPRRRVVLANAGLLAGSAAAFALSLYPPYQVVLAQLFVLLLVTTVAQRIARDGLPGDLRLRAAALGIAATIVAVAVAVVIHDAWDSIQTLRQTVYPGDRVTLGGGRALWEVFVHDLLVSGIVTNWSALQNALQAASFWLLFPVVAAGVALRFSRPRSRLDGTIAALLLFCTFLTLYSVFGFPAWAAQLTGLHVVPTERAVIGLGLADVILVVRFLATRGAPDGGRASAVVVALAWAGALALGAVAARKALPSLTPAWIAGACALNGVAAFGLLRARRPEWVLGTLAVVLVPCTAWFNPVVRGGADWVLHNPVSEAVRQIDAEAGGNTSWVVLNSESFPNLFRALGVRSLGGVFPIPQLELFRRIDPSGAFSGVYNRYANVLYLPKGAPPAEFRLRGLDSFIVDMPLDAASLTRLGATHVVFVSDRRDTWDRLPGLAWVRSVGKFHFYRVRPPARTDGGPSAVTEP